ncbi:hypothetical protein Taro_008074 [Colocasia esculenta]|uniref:Uncharacterized protein n=1 Tax=Colocasia esculenta TaxID=4460 RepID=A0A843TWN3_COLES|nr:hypothetical protein [Colocasia esculenta]
MEILVAAENTGSSSWLVEMLAAAALQGVVSVGAGTCDNCAYGNELKELYKEAPALTAWC